MQMPSLTNKKEEDGSLLDLLAIKEVFCIHPNCSVLVNLRLFRSFRLWSGRDKTGEMEAYRTLVPPIIMNTKCAWRNVKKISSVKEFRQRNLEKDILVSFFFAVFNGNFQIHVTSTFHLFLTPTNLLLKPIGEWHKITLKVNCQLFFHWSRSDIGKGSKLTTAFSLAFVRYF